MAALPDKYIPLMQSTVGLSAIIVGEMRANDTVSSLWGRLKSNPHIRTYPRFSRTLAVLFAASMIELDGGVIVPLGAKGQGR